MSFHLSLKNIDSSFWTRNATERIITSSLKINILIQPWWTLRALLFNVRMSSWFSKSIPESCINFYITHYKHHMNKSSTLTAFQSIMPVQLNSSFLFEIKNIQQRCDNLIIHWLVQTYFCPKIKYFENQLNINLDLIVCKKCQQISLNNPHFIKNLKSFVAYFLLLFNFAFHDSDKKKRYIFINLYH